jgi:putative acetyltransferase
LKRAAVPRYFEFSCHPHCFAKAMHTPALEISRADPRTPEAQALLQAMTAEVRATYDHKIDGHGNFKPEDVLVPGSGFVVGRIGREAVACGGFRPLEPGVAEIKRMFVDRGHRGRGYSKAILTTLERMATESGYKTVRLETRHLQTAAIALYEGLGYLRIPNYGMYEGKEGCLCYEKGLGKDVGE